MSSARLTDLPAEIVRCGELAAGIETLIARFGVQSVRIADGDPIPGSYWGAPEAGLIGHRIYWRADTPAHSLLHELAHFVCMTPDRRSALDTDAGSDDLEECAACYLEVRLAAHLPPFSAERCLIDMDRWGYSFREGSARAWFDGDGADARAWLQRHGLVDRAGRPCWRLRAGRD